MRNQRIGCLMLRPLSRRQTWIAIASGATLLLVLALFALVPSPRVATLNAENQRLQQRVDHLSSALNRFSADQADVATVIEELEAELAQLRRDYQYLASTADTAQQRVNNANARLDQLIELERQNQALQQQLDASRAETQRLQQQLDNQPGNPVTELY